MKLPSKLNLANIPTPIEKVVFNGCSFFMKRDDFTGMEYSGNKIRKLEYLLYKAKKLGCKRVITCGGIQSNHARATAFAAKKIGMESTLVLRGKSNKKPEGNLFLDKFLGSEIKFITAKEYSEKRNEIMNSIAEEWNLKGQKSYVIPEGGSNEIGVWGYTEAFGEFSNQLSFGRQINSIISACGSGGTTAGLLLGAKLLNKKIKIFAVNVCDDKEFFENKIFEILENTIKKYKLNVSAELDNLEIIDGYSSEGYTKIAPEKISVIKSFCRQSGIMLDPTYTGKAFYAYDDIFLKEKKKSKTLFIHTGGLFGAFDKKREYLFDE